MRPINLLLAAAAAVPAMASPMPAVAGVAGEEDRTMASNHPYKRKCHGGHLYCGATLHEKGWTDAHIHKALNSGHKYYPKNWPDFSTTLFLCIHPNYGHDHLQWFAQCNTCKVDGDFGDTCASTLAANPHDLDAGKKSETWKTWEDVQREHKEKIAGGYRGDWNGHGKGSPVAKKENEEDIKEEQRQDRFDRYWNGGGPYNTEDKDRDGEDKHDKHDKDDKKDKHHKHQKDDRKDKHHKDDKGAYEKEGKHGDHDHEERPGGQVWDGQKWVDRDHKKHGDKTNTEHKGIEGVELGPTDGFENMSSAKKNPEVKDQVPQQGM